MNWELFLLALSNQDKKELMTLLHEQQLNIVAINSISEISSWTKQNEGLVSLVLPFDLTEKSVINYLGIKQDDIKSVVQFLKEIKSYYKTDNRNPVALEICSANNKANAGLDTYNETNPEKPFQHDLDALKNISSVTGYRWDRIHYANNSGKILVYEPGKGWVCVCGRSDCQDGAYDGARRAARVADSLRALSRARDLALQHAV